MFSFPDICFSGPHKSKESSHCIFMGMSTSEGTEGVAQKELLFPGPLRTPSVLNDIMKRKGHLSECRHSYLKERRGKEK